MCFYLPAAKRSKLFWSQPNCHNTHQIHTKYTYYQKCIYNKNRKTIFQNKSHRCKSTQQLSLNRTECIRGPSTTALSTQRPVTTISAPRSRHRFMGRALKEAEDKISIYYIIIPFQTWWGFNHRHSQDQSRDHTHALTHTVLNQGSGLLNRQKNHELGAGADLWERRWRWSVSMVVKVGVVVKVGWR